MRVLAIGDVHGCYNALMTLLHEVRLTGDDQLVFLGDYIDRGPASKSVVEWMISEQKKSSAVFLRGNHEVMILEARSDPEKENLWRTYGGFETLESYSAQYLASWSFEIPRSHWDFFNRTAPYFQTARHIFVHACIDSELDMEEQPAWLLHWEFFERIRPHKSGKKVICGHTAQRSGQIKDLGFAVCIDTGAAIGGWLTCLDVDSGEFWQANEGGETRKGTLHGFSA